MTRRKAARQLLDVLDDIRSGQQSPAQAKQRHPELADDIIELAEVASAVRSDSTVEMGATARNRVRAQLLQAMTANAQRRASHPIAGVLSRPWLRLPLAGAAIATLLTGGVVYAAQGVPPDSPLYPVHQAVEVLADKLLPPAEQPAPPPPTPTAQEVKPAEVISARSSVAAAHGPAKQPTSTPVSSRSGRDEAAQRGNDHGAGDDHPASSSTPASANRGRNHDSGENDSGVRSSGERLPTPSPTGVRREPEVDPGPRPSGAGFGASSRPEDGAGQRRQLEMRLNALPQSNHQAKRPDSNGPSGHGPGRTRLAIAAAGQSG